MRMVDFSTAVLRFRAESGTFCRKIDQKGASEHLGSHFWSRNRQKVPKIKRFFDFWVKNRQKRSGMLSAPRNQGTRIRHNRCLVSPRDRGGTIWAKWAVFLWLRESGDANEAKSGVLFRQGNQETLYCVFLSNSASQT